MLKLIRKNKIHFLFLMFLFFTLSIYSNPEKRKTISELEYIKEFIKSNYRVEPEWEIRIVTSSSLSKKESQIYLCFVGEELSNILDKEKEMFYSGEKEICVKERITHMAFIFRFDDSLQLKYLWAGGPTITGKIEDVSHWLKEYEELSNENVKEKIQSLLKEENAKYLIDAEKKLKEDIISKNTLIFLGDEAEIERIYFDIQYSERPKSIFFIWRVRIKTSVSRYELLVEPFNGYIIRIHTLTEIE